MAVEAQNLLKQINEQVLQRVQDFYGKSLGSLESRIGEHRSQLQELQKQLADSQENMRAQIGQLIASYEAIEKSLQETAREQGVEETVSQAVQQAQVAAGRTAQQVAGQAPSKFRRLRGKPHRELGVPREKPLGKRKRAQEKQPSKCKAWWGR